MVPALLTAAVVPFGSELDLSWLSHFGVDGTWLQKPSSWSSRTSVSVLFIPSPSPPLAFTASSSQAGPPTPSIPSRRRAQFCQMISYEIALGLSIIPVLMISGI